MSSVPIITIDGPSGSGKGTIAAILALKLGFHLLDSGAIYRIAGLAAARQNLLIPTANVEDILKLVRTLQIKFAVDQHQALDNPAILLNNEDVSGLIRTERVGEYASLIGAIPEVRTALLQIQYDFAKMPGLIADGRDMGTVVFPNAIAKIYLTASAEARAERRMKQLQKNGYDANLATILSTIQARDHRDMNRAVAPLRPAGDALLIDGSDKTIDEVIALILEYINKCAGIRFS